MERAESANSPAKITRKAGLFNTGIDLRLLPEVSLATWVLTRDALPFGCLFGIPTLSGYDMIKQNQE